MLDDTRNGAKRLRKTRRIRYAPEMGVDDPVAMHLDGAMVILGEFGLRPRGER